MPIILLCVLIFVVWFKYERDKSGRLSKNEDKLFWSREYKSNYIRKSDLSNLAYIDIPLDTLPFMKTEAPSLLECQQRVRDMAGKKIVNLTGYSNTDLKYQYGTANITALTQYDENFTRLARALFQWGQCLYENHFAREAAAVLEYAVSCKSDISGIYKLLAKIYKEEQQEDKIQALLEHARELPSLMKNSILEALESILAS